MGAGRSIKIDVHTNLFNSALFWLYMSNLDFIRELGIEDVNLGGFSTEWLGSGSSLDSFSPADGSLIATVKQCDSGDYEKIMQEATSAFKKWRMEPAPK